MIDTTTPRPTEHEEVRLLGNRQGDFELAALRQPAEKNRRREEAQSEAELIAIKRRMHSITVAALPYGFATFRGGQ